MLGIALAAIVLACLLMILSLSKYGFSTKVAGLSGSSSIGPVARADRSARVDSRGEGLLSRLG
jgi:hypothetical protein